MVLGSVGRSLYVAVLLLLVVLGRVRSWSLQLAKPRSQPVSTDRVHQAESLIETLKEGKSYFHPQVRVVSVDGDECGIQFQSSSPPAELANNEDVIFVDRAEFVTPQKGIETPLGQALQVYLSQPRNTIYAFTEKLPHMYLALFLAQYKQGLWQSTDRSATMDYLETLPSLSALQHLPLFWDQTMLEELQCSVLKSAVRSRREEWKQEFVVIHNAIKTMGLPNQFRSLTLETWYWARSIVSSRAFTDLGNNNLPCLCPYVDMMNHVTNSQLQDSDNVVKCTWDIDGTGYHLRLPQLDDNHVYNSSSLRLEISYGCHSNAHFLMNYGFCIQDDQEQSLEELATLPVILPDSNHEEETESLWEADGLGNCHQIARNVTLGIGDVGPMESVLSLCRVASAHARELSGMKENFVRQGQRTLDADLIPQLGATVCRTPFSVDNEIRALQMLQIVTQAALGRYATTLDEDNAMLLDDHHNLPQTMRRSPWKMIQSLWNSLFSLAPESGRQEESLQRMAQWRNAVTLRREEKKILNHYFLLASMGLEFLQYCTNDEHFETYKGMLDASLHDPEPLVMA
mmetsp:Transcript_27315/g.79182  ORF Transcript_27315/g.79182 Transcript_27315/m.79182 type:complete len:571 (+) Transcript_27315:2-1714(+)